MKSREYRKGVIAWRYLRTFRRHWQKWKKVNQVTAERWIKGNASWVAAMVAKHDSWIKDNAVDLYQAAYDGELDEIEQRDKARDGGTEISWFLIMSRLS